MDGYNLRAKEVVTVDNVGFSGPDGTAQKQQSSGQNSGCGAEMASSVHFF
jgi:hypothetical protein